MNKKVDLLLFAGAISNLFYSIAYPVVHTITVQSINSNILSFTSLLNCIFVVIITKIWLSKSEKLYKYFGILLFLEAVAYTILTILFLTGLADSVTYFIADGILGALITRNIICGGTRLKSRRYIGEKGRHLITKPFIIVI